MKVALVIAVLAATAAAFVPYKDGVDTAAWYSLATGSSFYIENTANHADKPFVSTCASNTPVTGGVNCYYHSLGDAIPAAITAPSTQEYCFVYLYPELGCSGIPLQVFGAQTAAQFDHTTTTSTKWFDSYNDYATRNTDLWDTPNPVITFDNGPLVGMFIGINGLPTDPLAGNLPVGCTDMNYLPWFRDTSSHGWGWTSLREFYDKPSSYTRDFTPLSAFVICNGKVECPRTCEGVKCGVYDSCGMPCVGSCPAGQYCAVDGGTTGTEYVCKPAQYGSSTWFTTFHVAPHAKRYHSPEPYYEPTITHIENALVADLAHASQDVIPKEAIVIDSIEFETRLNLNFNLQFTINVDTVNAIQGTSYTVAQLDAFLSGTPTIVGAFSKQYQVVDQWLGGPFTYFMDTTTTFPLSVNSGTGVPSTSTATSDEWVPVVIPDSWLPPVPVVSTSGAATLAVSWIMCVVAALMF